MATAKTEKFQIGDIVQLKSGGPKMTVAEPFSPFGGGSVECQWFAGSKLERGHFPGESLVPVPDEKKP